MTAIHAKSALTPTGWRRDVRLVIAGGRIASVDSSAPPGDGDERVDVLIPGMSNVHSHAFQRGMAGLAEIGGPAHDNFWSWRTAMYRFALAMSPMDVQAVAAMVYVEMLEAGFTRVGEFHYLHHDRDGRPYGNTAEMAGRIAEAAGECGIGLTLLPCFYAHAGFGGTPPVEGQRRFVCDPGQFAAIVDGCRSVVKSLPGAVVGIAPHSLRAVTPEELSAVVSLSTGPIHIHAAEQLKEVQDCIAWSGARPVQWLLDHADVNDRWCVIHATHMTEDETRRLASTGAIAGLCPITEANLGDGTFSAAEFSQAGGRFGIGSDSNVLIGVTDELRQLEYAQRLHRGLRNVISAPGHSTGRTLFDRAVAGGGASVGWSSGLSVGSPADFVSLAAGNVPHLDGDGILDAWIFTRDVKLDQAWVAGERVVTGGLHRRRRAVRDAFRQVVGRLSAQPNAT
jgi:formimidoylglutamate deiminase